MLYKANRTRLGFDSVFKGSFNMPGYLIPGHQDHRYGPLATIVESILRPGTWIRFHPHQNDEIISYVPEGVMRHNDETVGELVADNQHLMVMNAGREFWHEERTLPSDPPLRMLQIFVRAHTLHLEPHIQHGLLERPHPGQWRHLFGPEGWSAYFYVFTGNVEVGDQRFAEAESGLLVDETGSAVKALAPTLLVVFLINPKATVTRSGTIGR